jgi:cytochrome c biogenesis protein CcmG, thiol:disulfide interchange protein DsbE
MAGHTYYTLLDVPVDATVEEIMAAYQRQRDRYGLERVAPLGDEFRHIAAARLANLERAYAALSDPQQREDYDRRIGVSRATTDQARRRPGLSRREQALAIGGALAGLLVIALVWMLTERSVDGGLVPVAETARPAPEFALPGLNGETVRLSDHRGKIVLVNFWGTWCEPCKEETPALQAAYQQLREQGLVIIGVDLRKQERPGPVGDADIRAFVERFGVTTRSR